MTERDDMTGQDSAYPGEETVDQAAEGDRLEQDRELRDDPHDPERTTRRPRPDGVEANPADVAEQAIEVPDDEDDDASR